MSAAAFTLGQPLSDCRIGWMVNRLTGECIAKGCGKWSCVECGPRNVRRLAARFRREMKLYNRFITLTLSGAVDRTRATFQRMRAGWRQLYFWLKREFALLDYAWVHEFSPKNGRLHKHLVVRSDYVPQKLLSAMAQRFGLGKVVHIRRIKQKLGMRSYLSKYLVKDAQGVWPRYQRHVQHTLSPELRSSPPGVWTFEPNPRSPWRRRPEIEPTLPEEIALAPEPRARAPGWLPFPK